MSKIRICPDCGNKIGSKDSFCSKCGFKVIHTEDDDLVSAKNDTVESIEPEKPINEYCAEENSESKDDIDNSEGETSDIKNILIDKAMWVLEKLKELWSNLDIFMKVITVSAVIFLTILLVAIFSNNTVMLVVLLIASFLLICSALKHKGIIKHYDNKLKYISLILAWIVCVLCLSITNTNKGVKDKSTGVSQNKQVSNEIVTNDIFAPVLENECVGNNYNDISSKFSAAGFANIVITEIADLELSDSAKLDSVESVEINGAKGFTKEDAFKSDTKVEIKYHVYKKISMPISSGSIANVSVDELEEKLNEAGFANISVKTLEDIDPDVANDEFKNEVKIGNNSSFESGDLYPLDAEIQIVNHVPYAKYNITMHVNFVPNLLFDRYKVAVKIDSSNQGTLGHGEDKDFVFRLKAGTYKVKFEKEDDSKISGSLDLKVAGNIEMTVKIGCESDYINVETTQIEDSGSLAVDEVFIPINDKDIAGKDMESLRKLFEDAGFSNVVIEPIYDVDELTEAGNIEEVGINNASSFKKGDIVKKDVPVQIKYHEKETKNPVNIEASKKMGELEKTFPKDMAIRAVTVAMTNSQAVDVYKPDGFTLNPSKFHSYDELNEFFLTIVEEGKWNATDDSWIIDNMMFRIHGYETYMRVSCKVKEDDDEYIVYNVTKIIATKEEFDKDDLSIRYPENIEPSEDHLYLTVPYSLIEKDRDKAKENELVSYVDKHKQWVENQFYWWDGRHTKLCELIEKKLNAKSFKYEKADGIEIYDESIQKQVNDTLKKSGFSERVEIGDLFIVQEFSAKTKDGQKFSATAYGIAVYKTDSVFLLGTK